MRHFLENPLPLSALAFQNLKGVEMKLMEPTRCRVDVEAGALVGASNRYLKTLADLSGLYEDADAFDVLLASTAPGVVAYEVTDFKPSSAAGDMIFGVTRMAPGRVGNEFFLTRGHIHANANRPEIYYGEAGHGLMLMESPEGELRAEEISARTLVYVPPYWIHRSINLGGNDLVMTFAYPSDSGQDYGVIAETGGMKARVMDDGAGGWRLADNNAYRPRSTARIADIYASGR